MKALSWIRGYYLASPLFLLMGLWWGLEIRVVFIPDPGPRFLYYLALSALGLLAHYRPFAAPWVALGESTLNLLLIVLWILLPVYGLSDAVLGPEPLPASVDLDLPYTTGQVLVNGLLAGSFFLVGFYKAQEEVLKRHPWLGGAGRRGPGAP